MKPMQTFKVVPALPARLERLRELAYNLRWSWNPDTIELFRRIDRPALGGNPSTIRSPCWARSTRRASSELAEDEAFWPTWTGRSGD